MTIKKKFRARKKRIKDAKRRKNSRFVSANGTKKTKPYIDPNIISGSVGVHNV